MMTSWTKLKYLASHQYAKVQTKWTLKNGRSWQTSWWVCKLSCQWWSTHRLRILLWCRTFLYLTTIVFMSPCCTRLCAPDLPFIFWALIRIPLRPSPANAMDAIFDALDEFLTKMQEVDRKFMVFLHNLSQYGSLNSLPQVIDNPEGLPTESDDWLVYFPQAKSYF